MNFEAILSDLKAKKYQPVYFLMGEESYFIDYISDYISNEVLNDTEKNLIKRYCMLMILMFKL